ncbi:hypothetical protein SEMRO_377_G129980.1 [Seminavis robusta]|uniref:Uncharacterized protein n=1 Tax=Seminavis robusta TaxID=568900 RepID=A0A9N8HE90_9STRA|nr:hypothetical protein SEMRO_377_G129980.1 [Seminavis robusta]|eukprot:Sro377_g129980.1 n/a (147) ;mRNA; f:14979-15419
MASKRKRNLKRGTFVEEKAKPHRRGVILGAFQDEGKKHTWNVEFEQPDGSKAKEVKTSRQLIAKDAPSTVDVPAVAVPAAEAAPVTIVEEASANLSGSESSKDDSSEAPTPPPTPPHQFERPLDQCRQGKSKHHWSSELRLDHARN